MFGARGLDSLSFLMSFGPLAEDFVESFADWNFWANKVRWKALGASLSLAKW